MRKLKPYIGITGLMSHIDSYDPLSHMDGTGRFFMAGVLASLKTLRGQENSFKSRYPKVRQISEIFHDDLSALNLIHYNTKDQSFLTDQLFWLTDIGGPNLHGFQLNIAWPSVKALADYRVRYSESVIVLQVGSTAMKEAGYNQGILLNKVKMYRGLADYVLLDASGGLGKPLDPLLLKTFLNHLHEGCPEIRYGVAGGLGPATLNLLEPLVAEFPGLSIDAESKLRDKDDRLDWHLADQYIREACRLFSSVK